MKTTVLILVYNHEKYIERCLESVFRQKNIDNIQIVINNDASTDGSSKIIDKFIGRPNVKYIDRTDNVGAKESLISMLKQVKTDYISIIEGDDYWINDEKLLKQEAMLDNNKNLSCTHGNSIIVDENDIKTGDMKVGRVVTLDAFLLKNNMPLNTMLFRNYTEIFTDNYYKSEIICDIPLKVMLLSRGESHLLPENVTAYRHITTSGSSFSAKSRKYKLHQTLLALEGVENICYDNVNYNIWRIKIYKMLGEKEKANRLYSRFRRLKKLNILFRLMFVK